MKLLKFLYPKNLKHLLTAAILPFALYLIPHNCFAQSSAVPFTLEDRDRIMQMQITMNEHFESMQKEMNTRFAAMNTRFESVNVKFESMNVKFESMQQQLNDVKAYIQDLRNLFYWAFGVMITLMTLLFGFIVLDRKTITQPIKEQTQSLIQTLREYAKKQPELADILRSHGLL